jgi:hypothetical protein
MVPQGESGKPYYIMIGNSIKYEPGFVQNEVQLKNIKEV